MILTDSADFRNLSYQLKGDVLDIPGYCILVDINTEVAQMA